MILVTGGTGFLGTHLLRELVKRGESVRAIRRSTGKIFLEEEFSQHVDWVECDVLDVMGLEEAMDGCEKVYHCAAMVTFLPRDQKQLMKINVEGTRNVVNAALEKKISKLVHVSSVAAIGRNRAGVVNENTEWDDNEWNSTYAISKFLAEREVQRGIAEGLNAVIVNPSLIIGPGNWATGTPHFFTDVWKGMPYYSMNVSGMVDVKDVVKAMILLMENEIHSDRFILSSEDWNFKQFFDCIAQLLGKKKPFINVKPWMMKILWRTEMLKYYITGKTPLVTRESARIVSHDSRFDNSKMVTATGFKFTPIQECLKETARIFLEEIAAAKK